MRPNAFAWIHTVVSHNVSCLQIFLLVTTTNNNTIKGDTYTLFQYGQMFNYIPWEGLIAKQIRKLRCYKPVAVTIFIITKRVIVLIRFFGRRLFYSQDKNVISVTVTVKTTRQTQMKADNRLMAKQHVCFETLRKSSSTLGKR